MPRLTFTPLEARIDPESAEHRRAVLIGRIAALEAEGDLRTVLGEADDGIGSVRHAYLRMLRAQRDFAEAQISASRPQDRTSARPPQEHAGG